MSLLITIVDEEYRIDYNTALDIVMAKICQEKGWDAHIEAAVRRRTRLEKTPADLIEALRDVSIYALCEDFRPKLSEWVVELNNAEGLWQSHLTKIEIEYEFTDSTLEAYGY